MLGLLKSALHRVTGFASQTAMVVKEKAQSIVRPVPKGVKAAAVAAVRIATIAPGLARAPGILGNSVRLAAVPVLAARAATARPSQIVSPTIPVSPRPQQIPTGIHVIGNQAQYSQPTASQASQGSEVLGEGTRNISISPAVKTGVAAVGLIAVGALAAPLIDKAAKFARGKISSFIGRKKSSTRRRRSRPRYAAPRRRRSRGRRMSALQRKYFGSRRGPSRRRAARRASISHSRSMRGPSRRRAARRASISHSRSIASRLTHIESLLERRR